MKFLIIMAKTGLPLLAGPFNRILTGFPVTREFYFLKSGFGIWGPYIPPQGQNGRPSNYGFQKVHCSILCCQGSGPGPRGVKFELSFILISCCVSKR